MKALLTLLSLSFLFLASTAQEIDSLEAKIIEPKEPQVFLDFKTHNPKTASRLSAIIPGAGQIYNRKYWKVPIVWGALGFTIWQADTMNRGYQDYRVWAREKRIYQTDVIGDPTLTDPHPDFTLDLLEGRRDLRRRNRDLMIIITTGLWILNVVDASVDAHLYEFDVSDDLSMKTIPTFQPLPNNEMAILPINFKLKF